MRQNINIVHEDFGVQNRYGDFVRYYPNVVEATIMAFVYSILSIRTNDLEMYNKGRLSVMIDSSLCFISVPQATYPASVEQRNINVTFVDKYLLHVRKTHRQSRQVAAFVV